MTDDNKPTTYSLSRRKTLAGLGAIGLASAGAGLGTSAFFSDTESFTGNTLTAGTLDMSVTATIEAASEYFEDAVGMDLTADDSEAVAGLVVDDIKPGDWAVICFHIEVGDNPGYVMVSAENFTEDGGENTEPEQSAESGTDNDADLGEFLLTTVWQEYNQNGAKGGLTNLDPVFNLNSNDVELSGGYQPSDLGGVVNGDVHYTNAREADTALDSYIIKDANGDPLPVNDTESEGVYSFCLLLELPFEVGNDIQGDSLSFDLVFDTEQVRNNDDPFNNTVSTPTSSPTPTPTGPQ
jgi:predicted ribosomally synthesized peptide with SipW-like signal peptide